VRSFGFVRVIAAVAAVGLTISACGADDNDASDQVTRTDDSATGGPGQVQEDVVDIEMVDIAFEPTAVEVKAGEPVTFRFTNNGAVQHEAIFGDESEQEAHAEEMGAMDGMDIGDEQMDMDGDGAMDMPTSDMSDMDGDFVLEPGTSGEVTMTFNEAGSTIIGCHEPGHWEAGMRVEVTITT
jgi:uncharacterized cupredoxin-like copper-binding protein